MRIAINGVGVAGPTLAYWLRRYGHQPLLIEKAPELRTGGYVIDFWGVGYDIAEKMGLIPKLQQHAYYVKDFRWVNSKGKTSATFSADAFREMNNNRYFSIERSKLAASIYGQLDGEVETLFGDSVAGIEQQSGGVRVSFEQAAARDFDLVVGADGLHSRVRELTFGKIDQFEKDLGLRIAAIELEGYQPRDEDIAVSYSEPGRQVIRFTKREDKVLILFCFRSRFENAFPTSDEQRKAAIEQAFDGAGWECPQLLSALRGVQNIYYDRVSQIRMNHWAKQRTALVGDSAACVSLLAGEGTGLAMCEAYVLAGEISRAADDLQTAFAAYEKRLMPFLRSNQESAVKFASSFLPNTRVGICFRNLVARLLPAPWAAKIGLGSLVDDIKLPAYEGASQVD